MKTKNSEIRYLIGGFINNILDDGNSYWITATEQEWVDSIVNELFDYKIIDGCFVDSQENRFDSRKEVSERVRGLVQENLQMLYKTFEIETTARNK